MVTTPTSPNLLHFKDTAARLSLSESSLKRRLKEDQSFPRPVQVGKRRIAFIEAEIDAFIHARIADRDRAGSKAASGVGDARLQARISPSATRARTVT